MFPVRLSTANQCSARFRDRFLSLSCSLSLTHSRTLPAPLSSNAETCVKVNRNEICWQSPPPPFLVSGSRPEVKLVRRHWASVSAGARAYSSLPLVAQTASSWILPLNGWEEENGRAACRGINWRRLKFPWVWQITNGTVEAAASQG